MKDKQIEERTCIDCIHYNICSLWTTTDLDEDEAYLHCYNNCKTIDEFAKEKGYVKPFDLFIEIENEIYNELKKADNETIVFNYDNIVDRVLDKLKKKYTESEKENEISININPT